VHVAPVQSRTLPTFTPPFCVSAGTMRMSAVEREVANLHGDFAGLSVRLDKDLTERQQ
jgi:hypothetical protein